MPKHHKFLPTLSVVRITNRGYLPHWEAPGATYSVTFRLHDAAPPGFIRSLIEEKKLLACRITGGRRKLTAIESMKLREDLERKFDRALDCHNGAAYMQNPAIADIVATAITHFDKVRYELDAWCVMPNHVHTVVRPLESFTLHDILHSWKSWSANQANKMLRRKGKFWQPESFDRILRDEEDLQRTVQYVVDNPVKAGLKGWKWVSDAGWKPADRQAGSLRSERR